MGQSEILKILQELPEDEWISSTKLLSKLDFLRSTMLSSLGRMRKHGEVQSRKIKSLNLGHEHEHRLTAKGRL